MNSPQLQIITLTADPTIRQSLEAAAIPDVGPVRFSDDASGLLDALTSAPGAVVIDELAEPAYVSLIKRARKLAPGLDAVVAGGPKSDAVRRDERREAVDLYIDRPLDARTLRSTLAHRLTLVALKARSGIIGRSPALEELLESVLLVAPTEVPILIQGESGTGKDVIARAIHASSRRRDRPFEAVNCGALAEGVLESELFGHERGAFTGAVSRRPGMFERTDTGTIFLDEVGETSPNMQVRLLRVLESGEVLRVGGVTGLRVDVRVIAASNRNLADAVRSGAFRQDLYYRLKGVSLHLPPLRERREDVQVLVQHFIAAANRTNQKSVRGVDADAMNRLVAYSWPGNIRELKNLVETLVVLAPGARITRELVDAHLSDAGGPARAGALLPVAVGRNRDDAEREMLYGSMLALHRDVREILRLLHEGSRGVGPKAGAPWNGLREVGTDRPHEETNLSLDHLERAAIREALIRAGGNRRRAAEYLEISERTLYRKIKEFGLA